jgi:hypothetical protein
MTSDRGDAKAPSHVAGDASGMLSAGAASAVGFAGRLLMPPTEHVAR